jgi:hypothetical protein
MLGVVLNILEPEATGLLMYDTGISGGGGNFRESVIIVPIGRRLSVQAGTYILKQVLQVMLLVGLSLAYLE